MTDPWDRELPDNVGKVGILAVALGLAIPAVAVAQLSPDESLDWTSSGGGDPGNLGDHNTTVVLDADADSGPVVAGQWTLGSTMNQIYRNLTDGTSYSVVNPDDVAVANLTAEDNHIFLQAHDVNVYGTWALFLEEDWTGLGTLADPILTYEITDGEPDSDAGEYARVTHEVPDVGDEVRACDGKVSLRASVDHPNGEDIQVDLPTGGDLIVVNMTYERRGLDDDNEGFAEFQIVLRGGDGGASSGKVKGADARVMTTDDSGVLRTAVFLDPNSDDQDEVVAECQALGPTVSDQDAGEVRIVAS